MGSNSGSNSGGNTGPANRYKTPAKKAIDKVADFVKGGGITGAVIRGVSGAIQKSKTDKQLQGTSDYQGSTRRSSISIAGGSQRGNDNDNSNVVVQAPTVSGPSEAEVSQTSIAATPEVTSEEARDSANLLLKKRRGRGRSQTILTSAQGVQKNEGLTLGKPSLLG